MRFKIFFACKSPEPAARSFSFQPGAPSIHLLAELLKGIGFQQIEGPAGGAKQLHDQIERILEILHFLLGDPDHQDKMDPLVLPYNGHVVVQDTDKRLFGVPADRVRNRQRTGKGRAGQGFPQQDILHKGLRRISMLNTLLPQELDAVRFVGKKQVPEIELLVQQLFQKGPGAFQLPLLFDSVQGVPDGRNVLFGQNGAHLYHRTGLSLQRQRGDDKITVRAVLQIAVEGHDIQDHQLVGKILVDLPHQRLGERMIAFRQNDAGDPLGGLGAVLQVCPNVEGNKGDLVFAELDVINPGEPMRKVHRHVVDGGIVRFELPGNGVRIAQAQDAPLKGVVHVHRELERKIIAENRGAVPFGKGGQGRRNIIDKLFVDHFLDVRRLMLHRKRDQHHDLLVVRLGDPDVVVPVEGLDDQIRQRGDLLQICDPGQAAGDPGAFLLAQVVVGFQADQDHEDMHQKIVQGIIVQKELCLLAGVIEFLHDASDVPVGEELFQGGFGAEKAVEILRCQMADQPALVLLAAFEEIPILLGFDLQIVIPDHLFDLGQDGVCDGAGADVQLLPHLVDVHPLLAGQQTREDLPHPGVILRGSFRRGQGPALLQPVAVPGGEDPGASAGIDLPDVISDRPLADAEHTGKRGRRNAPVRPGKKAQQFVLLVVFHLQLLSFLVSL